MAIGRELRYMELLRMKSPWEMYCFKKINRAKRYASRVGVGAIQEISSAKNYYKADRTAVVTNNYFTDSAKELAKVNNVKLIDRDALYRLINKRAGIHQRRNKVRVLYRFYRMPYITSSYKKLKVKKIIA